MFVEKTFDTGEVVINYAEGETAGPPLVVLHGSTLNWQTFGDFLPALEQHGHIYACDLRGHGKSGRARSGYRVVDFVRDTQAFVERQIGQPTAVLGFSTGAMVALGLAARLPGLVRGIVLLDPPLMLRDAKIAATGPYEWLTWVADTLATSRTLEDVVARCQALGPEQTPEGALSQATMVHSLDPEAVACLLGDRLFDDFNVEQVLTQVTCPALLIRGKPELGAVVRDSDAALFQAYLPKSTTVQIEATGHEVIWGPPGEITLAHVTQFLDSI